MLRYFLSYRGVQLPLVLIEEVAQDALMHRNTYFRAEFNAQGWLLWLEKLAYGEVELRHDYRYTSDGRLLEAQIKLADEEPLVRSWSV